MEIFFKTLTHKNAPPLIALAGFLPIFILRKFMQKKKEGKSE